MRLTLRIQYAFVALTAILTSVFATPAATAAPAAPAPTSGDLSPSSPDPNPPLGGRDAKGRVVGGDALITRGTVQTPGSPALPTDINAAGFVVADLDNGTVLAARDPHGRYQPASVLKVLTSLVLLPLLPSGHLVHPSAAAVSTEGSAVGLVEGGSYTVDQLFAGLMLLSGNDAAMALSEAAGGAPAVVARMNETMAALGGIDTVIETPSGLDGWQQLTSAYDLALVLRQAVNNPRLVDYDDSLTGELPAQNVAGKAYPAVPLEHQGWQFLEQVPGALLVKSGFTDAALSTYMAAVQRNGHRYGVVFLRNQRFPLDQWQQAAALLDWAAALPAGASGVGTLIDPVAALPTGTLSAPPTTAAPRPTAPATQPPTTQPPTTQPPATTSSSASNPSQSASSQAAPVAADAGPTGRSAPTSILYALGIGITAIAVGAAGASIAARQRTPRAYRMRRIPRLH